MDSDVTFDITGVCNLCDEVYMGDDPQDALDWAMYHECGEADGF